MRLLLGRTLAAVIFHLFVLTMIPEAQGASCADFDAQRHAYFGDLHVHTSLSWDAYGQGERLRPQDAYRFAQGEPVTTASGAEARLDVPLDFTAVTDHAEYLGEIAMCNTPASEAYDSRFCQRLRTKPGSWQLLGARIAIPMPLRLHRSSACGKEQKLCQEGLRNAWKEVQDAARAANTPCRFTSFVGYEYTKAPAGNMMHRNVIFRNDHVPVLPTSAFEAETPEDLWRALQEDCLRAGNGCDVLAIPHNSNLSGGLQFGPISGGNAAGERLQAAQRARMEPLVEIYQNKGASECRLGAGFSTDEQCIFEEIATRDCPLTEDQPGLPECAAPYNYVRSVLALGLAEEDRLGVNPYRLGIIAGTDTHSATSGRVDEADYGGHHALSDDTPQKRLGSSKGLNHSPGGLAGIWATENTRDALFDALKRRETFGTSGPRIVVRFFGGFDLPQDLCTRADLVSLADAQGVPMGGELHGHENQTPSFVALAAMDKTPLQRLQLVKTWWQNSTPQEQVIDLIQNPTGVPQLCATWRDPDPKPKAAYYVRVLEMPTRRWSSVDCERLPADQRPAVCTTEINRMIQERAWTSPIWVERP
jgi:hypothetical protein